MAGTGGEAPTRLGVKLRANHLVVQREGPGEAAVPQAQAFKQRRLARTYNENVRTSAQCGGRTLGQGDAAQAVALLWVLVANSYTSYHTVIYIPPSTLLLLLFTGIRAPQLNNSLSNQTCRRQETDMAMMRTHLRDLESHVLLLCTPRPL